MILYCSYATHLTNKSSVSLLRHRRCIQVTAVAVDAVANKNFETPGHDVHEIGFINLINRNWQDDPDLRRLVPPASHYPEDEKYDKEDDDHWPEIEGPMQCDVGWMKFFLSILAPELYSFSIGSADWDTFYAQPRLLKGLRLLKMRGAVVGIVNWLCGLSLSEPNATVNRTWMTSIRYYLNSSDSMWQAAAPIALQRAVS